jgi:hypothetical protein
MSVTLFASGVVITDEMATRLDTMSEAVFLPWYLDHHEGEPPTGWPAPAAHKELVEWGIKMLTRHRLEHWELQRDQAAVPVTPWTGGDVEAPA